MSRLKSVRIAKGHSARSRLLSGFVTALLVTSACVATAAPAAAVSGPSGSTTQAADSPLARQSAGGLRALANAPGNPGVPSAPEVLFEEDFENTDGTAPVILDDYQSVDGHTYTAAPTWLTNCNGAIVNFSIPHTQLGNCAQAASSANLRQLAYALGVHGGASDAETNDAVSAYTEGNPGANLSEFETVNPIPLAGGSGRFLTFSVDASAKNCGVSAPQYRFSFLSASGAATPVGGQINACTSSKTVPAPTVGPVAATDISVGTYTSNGSVLFEGASLGIRMVNANGSGIGNDAAFDNIRILDVTPQLDKAFAPARVPVGGTSTLTLTVTNTSELAAKSGWGFTDELPAGLTVGSPATVGGTCTADVTAAAGSDSIVVANGALAAGAESCTITVPVTSDTATSYTNGADNITGVTGIDLPGDSTVEFVVPPAFSCTSGAGGLLFQYPAGPTLVQNVNMVTGAYDTANTIEGHQINAIGYNVLDDYVYGWDLTAGATRIVRVAADGTVVPLGTPAGSVNGSVVGDVDADGQYWVLNGTTWNQIDLEPGSATYMTVVDSGTSAMPAGLTSAGADWAYVPGGGDFLYSVGQSTDGQASLIRFDRATGVRTVVGSLGLGTGTWTFGAVYADANGYLYASNNPTGTIYRIDVDDVSAEVFAQGPASNANDGARCSASSILLDFGDAPATYGTTLNGDGARHGVLGYDEDAHTAPAMLGASIDPEDDGQPSETAVGDDDDAEADEDGVEFNPDLAYAMPTLRTGLDVFSRQPVENTLDVTASADGFVSVWVDWNQDGTFADDERMANAQAVTAGANEITFAQETNPAGVHAQVRVRYSTDAASIALATGAAPDGEVEDYRVLVERLVQPSVCSASDAEYSAFTFGAPVDVTGTGETGSSARFENVSVVDGVAVDLVITTIAGRMATGNNPPNGIGTGDGTIIGADDAMWNVSSDATLEYRFFEAGTTTPIDVNAVFTVNDMDGPPTVTQERATFSADDITGYAFAEGSLVDVREAGDNLIFEGNGNNSGDMASRFQVTLEGVNTFQVRWQGFSSSGFGFDGDGDLAIEAACSDFGDAPDTYGTRSASEGAQHEIVPGLTLGSLIDFDANGQPSDDALGDDENRLADEDGISDEIVVTVGDETVVTVTATNDTAEAATLAGWIDLDASGTFDEGERVTVSVPAESGTAEYELTFPAGTTLTDTFARFRLFPGAVAAPLPTGAATAGEVEDYAVTVIERELAIEKSSDFTADSRPGDTITYTVTATNTGTADYTAADPAVVFDDLAGVLDDADYNGDATARIDGADAGTAGFLPDSFLSWSGALAAGEAVTITYSVELTGGGDGTVRNVAWQPDVPPTPGDPPTNVPTCDPRTPDGTDPVTGEACGFVESELPKLTVEKAADRTDLPADGETVTYTVTVRNEGPGAFTDGAPARVTDDLSDVLDDGAFGEIVSPATGAEFDADAEELTWSGPLGAGESIQIVYTVTYDANAADGDHVLLNTVCVPASDALDPDAACDFARVPAAVLEMTKSVDPADGTSVDAGQVVTYTLSFENVGKAPATVDALDDLSGVLDDAVITDGPNADAGLDAQLTDDQLAVTGEVPVGETLTVTYSVTVNAYEDQADHTLGNVLSNGDGSCPPGGCQETENPIRHFSVTKAADSVEGVQTGDTITYTVTVTNDGDAPYTVQQPASVSDDLTDVLDDAAYNGDAVAVASDGSVAPAPDFASPLLTWSGALAVGESVEITYSVTVTNLGDHDLVNVATPVCATGVLCAPPAEVEVLLPSITPAKTSDPASGESLQAGDVVTYTLSWTNDGQASGPLDSTDDLSGILDDAEITGDPVADSADVDVVLDHEAETIRVTGDLAPGETVTVTYQATIRPDGDRGDNIAGNVLTPDVPPYECAEGVEDCDPFVPPSTTHPLGELDDWKTVDPATGTTVRSGNEMTYTLHFANTGEAAVDVARDDVLTMLLDDAMVTTAPAASDPALSVSEIADGRFSVTGTLAAGQEVTVTYTVTVNGDGERGDDQLGNFLVGAGQEPPAECAPADGERPDCTINYVSDVVVSKSADPASGTAIDHDQNVEYTLTFRNVGTNAGAEAVAVDYTDHLVDVLDDADLVLGPIPSDPSLDAVLDGDTIRITGSVPTGETLTVRYIVAPKAYDQQGDHVLGNVVAVTGAEPVCVPDSPLCTTHEITPPPPLATTGAEANWSMILAALALLGGGALLAATGRRRRELA